MIVFANGRGTPQAFLAITGVLGVGLLLILWRRINWAIVIAVATSSSLMLDFSTYFKMIPIGAGVLIVLALLAPAATLGHTVEDRPGDPGDRLPRDLGPRLHPGALRAEPADRREQPLARDWRTFMNYLDRKQYGQMSMIDRMFERRGAWSNQFGRHPHMGFWSYFEEQYSSANWFVIPFFALGLIGLVTAIYKRLEIGLPFFTLFLLVSVGLILYMNFADGTKYNFQTGDAYMEVRNRDYFFTPAFVFFGIAMGMGIGAVMKFVPGSSRRQPEPAEATGHGLWCLRPAARRVAGPQLVRLRSLRQLYPLLLCQEPARHLRGERDPVHPRETMTPSPYGAFRRPITTAATCVWPTCRC